MPRGAWRAKFVAMPPASPPSPAPRSLPSAEVLGHVSDAFAWPLLLLHADTTLAHANLAARQLLQRGQPLALNAQRGLRLADARHQPAFTQAWQAALAGRPPALLRWPASRHGDPWCAALRVLPQAGGEQPALLLLVLCPDSGGDTDLLALLSLRLPLAPAEARPPARPPAPRAALRRRR